MKNIYDIQSFSSAFSIAIGNFAAISGIGFIVGTFVIGGGFGFLFVLTWVILGAIQSYYIFIANKSYKVDTEAETITIPKSGYGQTESWSFSSDFYWNLMKRQTINIKDIEDVIVESKRTETTNEENIASKEIHVAYHLKIIGNFGTSFFKFKSREKRDEISSTICKAVKEITGKELSCKDDYRPSRAQNTFESMINNF